MKENLLIIFCFLSTLVIAQKPIVIEGKIMNLQNDAIAFATISSQKTFVATTADFEGNFKLVLSEKSLPDTLIVRHISFESKKYYLTKNTINSLSEIVLNTKSNEVGTIEINALTPEQILKKSIEAISINYADGFYFASGFYRQAHKENNKFVRLIESFLEVKEDIRNRNSTAQKEKFRIENIRRSNVYERNGDKHGDHLVDLFSEDPINYTHSSFLNIQSYQLYNYSISNSSNVNLYKIFFQNKPWNEAQNKSGYLLINKTDYAIVEMEITSTKNAQYKKEHLSNWKFQNGTYIVQYKKYGAKYYCHQSSKYYNHYVLNEHSKNVDYLVEEYFNWWNLDEEIISLGKTTKDPTITEVFIDENGEKEREQIKKYKANSNLYSLEYNYDKHWNQYIQPKLEQKIIDDLNSFMDLEKQFLDD